jgi:hypothetical protein
MADVLLSLTLPNDVAQHVEDLLLSRPDLVRGFTASQAEGHGSVIKLVEARRTGQRPFTAHPDPHRRPRRTNACCLGFDQGQFATRQYFLLAGPGH